MHEPLISTIIPTYNRPSIIYDTIINVLNQTWKNIQIIIIDDGASEKTGKTIKSFSDDRIYYKKTEKNLGCVEARLLGMQISKGEFITFLDDDDEWNHNYLSNQLQVFNENPSLDIVICDYEINNENRNIYSRNMKSFSTNFNNMIHMRPGPFFQCCMFRRKILDNIEELLDNQAIPSEDWDFFLNLSIRNPLIGYSSQIGFKWNYSISSQSADLISEAKSLYYIVQKHQHSIIRYCGRITLSDHYRRIARIYERINDFPSVKQFYIKAFYSAPWWWKNILYIILLCFGQSIGFILISFGRKNRTLINE